MTEAKFRSFIINLLRQASYKWKPRAEAKKRARIGPACYLCACCGDAIYDGKKTLEKANLKLPSDIKVRAGKIKIDHIDPVVPITGWDGYDGFIARLFCEVENLQILCSSCHDIKSKAENELRRGNKK